MTVCHSSSTNNSLQNQTIFRRNIFLQNIWCPFVKNLTIPDRVQNKNSKNSKTYTYYYGEIHTLQNLPYCRGSSSDTTANKINPYYLIGQNFIYIYFLILIFQ